MRSTRSNAYGARICACVAARWFLIVACLCILTGRVHAQEEQIQGRVPDPQGRAVPDAVVHLTDAKGRDIRDTRTGAEGQYRFTDVMPGKYAVSVAVANFETVAQDVFLSDKPLIVNIQLRIGSNRQSVNVVADVADASVLTPDPAQQVLVREEIPDANPGRPGAPLSVPGLPIETASGGIKAPQYFAPGVAETTLSQLRTTLRWEATSSQTTSPQTLTETGMPTLISLCLPQSRVCRPMAAPSTFVREITQKICLRLIDYARAFRLSLCSLAITATSTLLPAGVQCPRLM